MNVRNEPEDSVPTPQTRKNGRFIRIMGEEGGWIEGYAKSLKAMC